MGCNVSHAQGDNGISAAAPMKKANNDETGANPPADRAETPLTEVGAGGDGGVVQPSPGAAASKKKKSSKKKKKKKSSKKVKKGKGKMLPELFPIVDDSAFTWAQKLEQNTCDVLNISRWRGKKAKACPLDHAVLIGALKANRRLKVLFFGKNKLSEVQLVALAPVLAAHPRLEKLSLDTCDITAGGVQALFAALSRSQSLRYVDLSANEFGCAGAAYCAAYLAAPTCGLDILALNGCAIKEAGGIQLAEALCKNSTLESLSLSRNLLSKAATKQLADVFTQERNLKLTNLLVIQTDISQEDKVRIKRGMRRNATMAELRHHKMVFLMATSPTLGGQPNSSVIRTALLSNGAQHPGYDASLIKNIWSYMHN